MTSRSYGVFHRHQDLDQLDLVQVEMMIHLEESLSTGMEFWR